MATCMIVTALNVSNRQRIHLQWFWWFCHIISLFLPSSSNLMSFAAWIPSSFRFFSICLLRAREALSSALMAQPMMIACSGVRRASLLETGEPQGGESHHHHSSSLTKDLQWPAGSHQSPLRACTGPLRAKMAVVPPRSRRFQLEHQITRARGATQHTRTAFPQQQQQR